MKHHHEKVPIKITRSREITVKVCPRCKSTHVREVKSTISGWLAPPVYVCEDCGFQSYTFVEIPISEIEAFKQAVAENENNPSYNDDEYDEENKKIIEDLLSDD